jgi:large subunit ribosomal protein L17
MRHRINKTKKLGRGKDSRRKLLRTLASSVIVHEQIETTQSNAKAIRGYVDKMITKGKVQTLHANRQLMAGLTMNAAFHGTQRRIHQNINLRKEQRRFQQVYCGISLII